MSCREHQVICNSQEVQATAIRNHRGLTSRTRMKFSDYRPRYTNSGIFQRIPIVRETPPLEFVGLKRSFRKSVAFKSLSD